ncbi:MAG: sugar phosphate isomerase/epimerase [Nanoarchaeota archaeon]|nr:sugar phosphate isomerase/epimerase [Nanoarchaeota archaeon]
MTFIVGVTSGLNIGGASEMATAVRKLGYALTKGANVIEIGLDSPHDIDYNLGSQMRYIAEKMGLVLTLHGSLTVPMTEGEAEQWGRAEDHMKKSIKSAVYCGAKYVNFHSCLYYWPELLTSGEMKYRATMVDEKGKHISAKLKDNEKLRDWFVEKMWDEYYRYILTDTEVDEIKNSAASKAEKEKTEWRKTLEDMLKKRIQEKLAKGEEWAAFEVGNWVDVYVLMANYMFFTRDKLLESIASAYPEFKINWNDKNWMYDKFRDAKKNSDKDFKEFFYGFVGAKYLEGHMSEILEWMRNGLISEIKKLPISDEEKGKLIATAKELKICIEIPDARDAAHAGLYTLWRPKQVIMAIKVIREKLRTDRIWALIDFEHIATQGIDPSFELFDLIKIIPNAGEYVYAVHSNYPNPTHVHVPLEIGDTILYGLFYTLRKAGLGRKGPCYLIFERGGGDDPFKRSVIALRLIAEQLEKDTPVDKLPIEFFGMAKPEEMQQMVAIREHALDPMKGLITVPEEEHGFFGKAAIEKGKGEEWKKEKYK